MQVPSVVCWHATPLPAPSGPDSMTCKSPMTFTPPRPAAWCAHTRSQTPADRKKATTEETSNQNSTDQPDSFAKTDEEKKNETFLDSFFF